MKISIYFLVAFVVLSNLSHAQSTSIDKDKEEILVRKIGHEVARYVGDSIQGLKPVKQIEAGVYQIEFNGPFAFLSDSVISIISREMTGQAEESDYIVKVERCYTDEVIFSYFISPKSDESVVACSGRTQEENCYTLTIGFVPPVQTDYEFLLLVVAGPLVLGLIFYGFWQTRKIDDGIYEDNLAYNMADMDNIPLGQFGFNFEEQYLLLGQERIKLTYKEAKLMKILSENQGAVVTRESIQQAVWEDDGAMISRSLDMFISKLRKKLKSDPGVEIKSIHGIGYKIIVS